MNQNVNPSEWEHYFTEEAIMVEELLSSGDFMFLSQSKIRIALENKILSWDKYKNWIQSVHEYAVLKTDMDSFQIEKIKNKYTENKKTFAHYSIWSEDLIAIELWDEHLVIIGLLPTEKLLAIPNAIFVLCPPEILKQIFDTEKNQVLDLEQNSSTSLRMNTDSQISLLEIDPHISKPVDLSFSSLKNESQNTQTLFKNENTSSSFSIWKQIENQHCENSDKARKQFDAYMVLKINENITSVFKMDDDLIKEDLNESLFKYEMVGENPFAKVFKSGTTESFNLTQLGLTILDFKFACITPLKLGHETLGFLVGFKISELTNQDVTILDSISNDNVA